MDYGLWRPGSATRGRRRSQGQSRQPAESHRRRLPPLRPRAEGQLKDKGVPVPEIAKKLTIKTGKNAGKSPSVASLYRALAEADQRDVETEVEIIGPCRPVRARITGPGSGTDPELMEPLPPQQICAA
ncbi:hypothetical protein FDG2_3529 [Candidatus Protofrankia californiensis]|uniref:Resolvase/invertase-type recombinase catalytic domain-containing protein n=1 Tax=Candidatus Protofrankia californiensis TaxID=1839754 RepID=A0A1C3NZS5_9ACTN|nr:hypothetical protein FDG2_3529 [Candidatus Protofrankia californiensis]